MTNELSEITEHRPPMGWRPSSARTARPNGGLRSLRDEMLEELERLKAIMRGEDGVYAGALTINGKTIRLPDNPKGHSTDDIINRLGIPS